MPSVEIVAERLAKIRKDLPLIIGNLVVEFALDSWELQGFQDVSLQPWPDRKDESDSGRAILVGKQGGRLRRSIRVIRQTRRRVTVGSEEEYAGIHNAGGTIRVAVTEKSRKFFWAMYIETEDDKWKYMALTKKTELTIEMPERRFIGDSVALDEKIADEVEKLMEQAFN